VKSYVFRKVFILLSYTVITILSLLSLGGFTVLSLIGVVIFVISAVVAAKIHSMFPDRHDRPEDFKELITDGPYAYCRHPFYLSLMVNQLSIPIMLTSWPGLLAYMVLLFGWYVLIRLEEKELIEYWGDSYLEYMRKVPAILPFRRK